MVQVGTAKSWGKRVAATELDSGSIGRDGRGAGGCGVGGRGDGMWWTGAKTTGSGKSSTVMSSRGMCVWRL